MPTGGTSGETGNAGESGPSNGPRTRGHISRACDRCRGRHLKCDEEPQCGQCALNNSLCERTGTDHRRERTAASIVQLETRVSELETDRAARTAELNNIENKMAELATKMAEWVDKATALETSKQQLIGEANMLRLSIEMRASLSVSGDSGASHHLAPPSAPIPREGSPDPTRYLRPAPVHGSEHPPFPYDRTHGRRHRRALSEHSVRRGRSGFPSMASSAVPSPHIPNLFIHPAEPPDSWNLDATSSASTSAFAGFPPPAVASPSASGYQHPWPVGSENTADDGTLFATWPWAGDISNVTWGAGPALPFDPNDQEDLPMMPD